MVTISGNDVYLTSGSVSSNTITGGTTVKISTTKIEELAVKTLIHIPGPVPKGQSTTTAPWAWTVDLKRIKRVFTVRGFLIDETGDTKETKRKNLRTLYGLGGIATHLEGDLSTTKMAGTVTAVWGVSGDRQRFKVNIQKYQISDDNVRVDKFPVIITLWEGEDR